MATLPSSSSSSSSSSSTKSSSSSDSSSSFSSHPCTVYNQRSLECQVNARSKGLIDSSDIMRLCGDEIQKYRTCITKKSRKSLADQ